MEDVGSDYVRLARAIDATHLAYLLPAFRRAERDWVDGALCKSEGVPTEWFYVDRQNTLRVADARAVCVHCPVRWDCLDYALATNERHGVWGGYPDKERRRIKRKLRAGVELEIAARSVRDIDVEERQAGRWEALQKRSVGGKILASVACCG